MTAHLILHHDGLKLVDKLATLGYGRVNSIITDPPYCVANKNTIKFNTRKDMSRDFGDWDYFEPGKYEEFIYQFMLQSNLILKPYGNLLTFCRLENITTFMNAAIQCGFEHKATIIWHKTNPAPRVRKTGLLSACEAILWSVKIEDLATNFTYDKPLKPTFHFGKQNEMHNFIETPICMGKERTKHPTQKPLKVINHLLNLFTSEGEIILDCFAGSGTVTESCILKNRNSISVEIEQESIDIMKTRLSKYNTEGVKVSFK